jgi:hypothetical protein
MEDPDPEQLELLVPPRAPRRPSRRRPPGRVVVGSAVVAALAVAVVVALVLRNGSQVAAEPGPRGFHVRDGVVVVDDARPRTVVVDVPRSPARPQGVVVRGRMDDEDLGRGAPADLSVTAVVRGITGVSSHCWGRPALHWVVTRLPSGAVTSGRCDQRPRPFSRAALEAYYWWPAILPVSKEAGTRRETARLFLTKQDPGRFLSCVRRHVPDCDAVAPPEVARTKADFGVLLWEAPPDRVGLRMMGFAVAAVTRADGAVLRLATAVVAPGGARRLTHTLPASTRARLLQVLDASRGYDEPVLEVDGRQVRQGGLLASGPSLMIPPGGSHEVTVSSQGKSPDLGFVVFERDP